MKTIDLTFELEMCHKPGGLDASTTAVANVGATPFDTPVPMTRPDQPPKLIIEGTYARGPDWALLNMALQADPME